MPRSGHFAQLLTVFVPCGAAAFPVMYMLMTQKTCAVFAAMHDFVPEPLLPAADIPTGLQEIPTTICNDMQIARQLLQLVTYVQRQWIDTGNATTSTDSLDTYDRCKVCLVQLLAGVSLVPRGHSCFCGSCADIVMSMENGCPIC